MAFKDQPKGFATKAIHAGQDPEQWESMAVVCPLVTSTTFKQDGPAQFRVIFFLQFRIFFKLQT